MQQEVCWSLQSIRRDRDIITIQCDDGDSKNNLKYIPYECKEEVT